MRWTQDSILDQSGKVFVVTGANSGVGLETSKALARHGAHVVMACRDLERSQKALDKVQQDGSAELVALDLADLKSIPFFVAEFASKYSALDGLVNNAGVMGGPRRHTAQGYELQMGTNHLGHFALTAALWGHLTAAPHAHVVSLSSLAAKGAMLSAGTPLEYLTDPQPFSAYSAYSNSKLATLIFAVELDRRIRAANLNVVSVAAHPGISATNLFNRQLREYHLNPLIPVVSGLGKVVLASPKGAARPAVMAATDRHLAGGTFIGPSLPGQIRGAPEVIEVFSNATDPATGSHLWAQSEELTQTFAVGLSG